MANKEQKTVLHVGCGSYDPNKLPEVFRSNDWKEIRLDIDERAKPDIVASMLDMQAVENDSVNAVYSSHNIEHLYLHQVPQAMKEFHRVVKPGGQIVLTLPDAQTVAAYVAQGHLEEPLYDSPSGPISPHDILYGWTPEIARGNHFMAHKTGFTATSLARHLLMAGFSNVLVDRQWVNLWAVAHKLPEDHPKRVMKAQIRNKEMQGPKGQRLPSWYERMLVMQADPEAKLDNLSAPTAMWKPLGLKSAK